MLPSPPPSILARANLDSPTTPSPDYALRSHLRHEITQPSSSWRPICRKLDTLCPSPRSGELRPFVATFAASNLAPVPFTDGFCFPHHRFLRLPSNISSIFFALRTPIRARRISHFRLNHQRERRYQSLLDPDEGPGRHHCARLRHPTQHYSSSRDGEHSKKGQLYEAARPPRPAAPTARNPDANRDQEILISAVSNFLVGIKLSHCKRPTASCGSRPEPRARHRRPGDRGVDRVP